ncbi:Clan CA, family C19, ubiquitin hydrolase-like cysteine peptidase [Tritrichomonas foetus]|uniref:Clan CA, family C19, ubiquitin hydrolase-like cysteine peptidase n=1 Tax=Tritrichomonas foetus TaxID=1144522 RepID=A0A1J4K9K5_9EUKA|nr:Clan CA, family C19, ubiquitin hydrolase-like cysteine peptidase [Tritrichomonas foetus]|eukprot:OHT06318.1 Clan CA, family C19, ubiquitin hydrolase-like cysteine peptidase [Tritrichomonas foetus]
MHDGQKALGRSIGNFLSKSDGPVMIAAPGQSFEYVWIIDSWEDQSIDPISPEFVIDNLAFHMQACRPKQPSQFFSVRVVLVEQPPSTKTFAFTTELINMDQSKSVSKRLSKAYSKINAYETFTFISARKITEKDGFLRDGALTIVFKYSPNSLRQKGVVHSPTGMRGSHSIQTLHNTTQNGLLSSNSISNNSNFNNLNQNDYSNNNNNSSSNNNNDSNNINNNNKNDVVVRSTKKSSSMIFTPIEKPIIPPTTQYSGLKNQGATCYMNSILQVLYHIPSFRKIVYSIPIKEVDDYAKYVPLNLQSLFWKMQFTKSSCSTVDLTRSFGWSHSDTTKQHDVVEFERELLQNLENKIDDPQLSGQMSYLFTGKMRTFIKCKNVDFIHTVDEDFDNLALIVRGCKSLEESLQKEISIQELVGDDRYKCEEFGLQDAIMGSEFLSFPPILMIQLRRFERDLENNRNIKINDRFEYPMEIDLAPFVSKSSDHTKNNVYVLSAVIVHSGSIVSGHYYAYIRPSFDVHEIHDSSPHSSSDESLNNSPNSSNTELSSESVNKTKKKEQKNKWYKFDDTVVTPVDDEDVLSKNFGGVSSQNSPAEKSFSAYMLMYVRKEDIPSIYEPITDESVPLHIREWTTANDERKKIEVPLDYIDIRLNSENSIRINAMKWTTGFDNRATAIVIRLSSDEKVHTLYEKAAEFLKLPISEIRLWQCGPYSIPDMPLADTDSMLSEKLSKSSSIFVQRKTPDEKVEIEADERVLFLKFFFTGCESSKINQTTIQYIGAKIVNDEDYVESVFCYVNKLVQLPESTPLLVFQETTLHTAQLIDDPQNTKVSEVGTLLIFQISPGIESPEPSFEMIPPIHTNKSGFFNPTNLKIVSYYDLNPDLAPATVDQYMDHKLRTLEAVMFDYNDAQNAVAIIRFPSNLSWPALKRLISIAVHRDYDPETDSMRIYKRDTTTGGPSKYPISVRFAPSMRVALSGSAPTKGERSHLYFNILQGIPESMLTSMANYNVQYSENAFTVSCAAKLLILKKSTLRQVAYEMQNRGMMPQSDSIRVLKIKGNRIITELDIDSVVTNYDATFRFEMIPIEQRIFDENEHTMLAVSHGYIDSHDIPHFMTDPFIFMCNKTDTVFDIRDDLNEWAEVPKEHRDLSVFMKLKGETNIAPLKNDELISEIVAKGFQLLIWEPRLENMKAGKARVTFVDHPPPREKEKPVKIYT